MFHVLTVQVKNKPGVLSKVSGLFARRGFNIDSLAVGSTEKPGISRMTIVVEGDETIVEQVSKQLYKLIDVVKIQDITPQPFVGRELVLFKVKVSPDNRAEIMNTIIQVFRGKIVDIGAKSLIIEATGDKGKLSAIESYLDQYGMMEIARTGEVAMTRGSKERGDKR